MRISGEAKRAEELAELYEKQQRVELDKEHIHTVSTLMKLFLKKMPEPLLTFSMYYKWILLQSK